MSAANFANTSVKRDHAQIRFNFEHAFDDQNKIVLAPYIGSRNNAQILTTTALATKLTATSCTSTGASQGTCARLSEIDRDFYGMDAHWDNNGKLSNMPYSLTFGLNYGKQSDARLDTNTLVNGLTATVKNRDEDNIPHNFDQYLQGKLSVLDNVDLHAGVRHTNVQLEVVDKFLTGAGNNGNNSGSVEYQKTTPVVGVIWKLTPILNVYANYGKGFETPTFIEAAFDNVTTGGASKPNLSLKAAQSQPWQAALVIKMLVTHNVLALRFLSILNGRIIFQHIFHTLCLTPRLKILSLQ